MHHLPNVLSLFRLAAAPGLLVLAWSGASSAFVVLLVCALASDAIDGQLARRFELASPLGAKLDSWGDLAVYAALPLGIYWLWPELIAAQWGYVVAVVVAFTLPLGFGLAKFGRITSYHTWGAKAASLAMGPALLVLFAGGPSWPFHAATALLVAEAIEELAITLVLPKRACDVKTFWHARRIAAELA